MKDEKEEKANRIELLLLLGLDLLVVAPHVARAQDVDENVADNVEPSDHAHDDVPGEEEEEDEGRDRADWTEHTIHCNEMRGGGRRK